MEAARHADESWMAARYIDPPSTEKDTSDTITDAGMEFVELPENGFGSLLAWAASLRRVRRAPERRSHQTRVMTVAAGTTTRHHRPRSPQEQHEVDDAIDAYLSDAAVPARPRGFRWFVELPAKLTPDDFWAAINIDLAASAATHPANVLAEVRTTLNRLYSTDPTRAE